MPRAKADRPPAASPNRFAHPCSVLRIPPADFLYSVETQHEHSHEPWRKDLERFRNGAGLDRVRCHGIFNDELGVGTGGNFQNANEVYNGFWIEAFSRL
jgi:hypothetical protein